MNVGREDQVLALPARGSEVLHKRPLGRGVRSAKATAPGLTLIELMVAMSILLILGGTLAMILRQGLSTWQTGETRRVAYEEGVQVLSQVSDDLRSLFARETGDGGARARLLADARWLLLVRTFPGEAEDPLAGVSGLTVGASSELDRRNDREEAFSGDLRAVAGLEEVAYVYVPRPDYEARIGRRAAAGALFRAVRSPAGGEGSLFEFGPDVADPTLPTSRFGLVSNRVLFVGVRFWGQYTTTWDTTVPPSCDARDPSGAFLQWDSTRALLPRDPSLPDDAFQFFRGPSSLYDPTDDVFPSKALVELVILEDGPGAPVAYVTRTVAARDDEIEVDVGARFPRDGGYALVGDEWVRLQSVRGNTLVVAAGGRGARWTEATDHAVNTLVQRGRAFEIVVDLPGAREDWNDR